jgi:signal transduction histidine kinase
VAMMLSVFVPTVVLGIVFGLGLRQQAQNEATTGSLTVVRVVGFGVDAVMQDARRTLEISAAEVADRPHGAEVKAQLRRLSSRYPLFSEIYLLDTHGRGVLAAISENPKVDLAGFSPELADNYGGYVSDVYRAGPRGTPHVFMIVEVRGAGLDKQGFLAAVIDLARLYTGLTDALSQGGKLLIVDGRGRPIYPLSAWEKHPTSLRQEHPAVDRVLSTLSEGHVTYTDTDGVEQHAVYRSLIGYNPYRGLRWGVVLERPTSEVFAAADLAVRNTAGVVIGFLLLALVVSVPLARAMTAALSRLAGHVREVGQAGVEATEPPPDDLRERADEIGDLARSMASMVGDLKASQNELHARHDALRRAERLSSVGVLAAGVAHEVNNPLTTILGYSEFLLEDKAQAHPDRASLELIASEASRVREIVRGLLELSRRRHGYERVDLRELIDRAVTLSEAGLDLGEVNICRDVPPDAVFAEIDRQALLQVLMNLISNAVDAMADMPNRDLTLACHATEELATIEVQDTGEGIDAGAFSQLYEPFYTTKPPGKGTGLGLAIVQSIMADHHGEIEVRSAREEGTTFTLSLPIRHRDDPISRGQGDSEPSGGSSP